MPFPITYLKVQKGFKIRYIRDWCKGGSGWEKPGYGIDLSSWREIQAIDGTGTNVALGKQISFSVPLNNVVDPYQINDGIFLEDNGADITSNVREYAQIDLGALYEIKTVKVWHGYSVVLMDTFTETKTEVSEDGVTWTVLFDSTISGVYLETLEGKTHQVPLTKTIDVPIYNPTDFPTSPLRIMTSKGLGVFDLKAPVTGVRYIRDWCGGSNMNTLPLWAEIMAFDQNGTNVALSKPYSFSPGMTIIDPGHVNDGIVSHVDDNAAAIWDGITPGEMYYAQIDLQSVIPLKEITVWHYYDGRIFNKSKLEVSTDGNNWIAIFDTSIHGTYPETMEGKKHSLSVPSPLRIMTNNGVKSIAINIGLPVDGNNGGLATIALNDYYISPTYVTVVEDTQEYIQITASRVNGIFIPIRNLKPNTVHSIFAEVQFITKGSLATIQFHIWNKTKNVRHATNFIAAYSTVGPSTVVNGSFTVNENISDEYCLEMMVTGAAVSTVRFNKGNFVITAY